jgi:hypothetical protein
LSPRFRPVFEPQARSCMPDVPRIERFADTFVEKAAVNEPIMDFDLPCGTIYETSHSHGDGTRWYLDRLVVKRHVAASAALTP